MIGVFVNSKEAPYAEMIAEGTKKIETRTRNTLRKLVGKRVEIIETGNGEPTIVGAVTIDRSIFIPEDEWEHTYRSVAHVSKNSKYDSKGNGKWCYFLKDNRKYNHPLPLSLFYTIRHGRVWCEYDW